MASAVENALAAYSGTTAAPHEYFDHTGIGIGHATLGGGFLAGGSIETGDFVAQIVYFQLLGFGLCPGTTAGPRLPPLRMVEI